MNEEDIRHLIEENAMLKNEKYFLEARIAEMQNGRTGLLYYIGALEERLFGKRLVNHG